MHQMLKSYYELKGWIETDIQSQRLTQKYPPRRSTENRC